MTNKPKGIIISRDDGIHIDYETNLQTATPQFTSKKPTEKKFNKGLNDENEEKLSPYANIGDSTALDMARKKLEELLSDDIAQQNESRLQYLLTNIEDAIRGDELLIPEDLIEFGTYLSSSDSKLRDVAIKSYRSTFDKVNKSQVGELRHTINGDLIIDVICDVITTNPNSNEVFRLINLLGITGKMCTLRHGFTRMFELYKWSLNNENNKNRMPTSIEQKISINILDNIRSCISLTGPDTYLSLSNGGCITPDYVESKLSKGWSMTCWIKLSKEQKADIYDILYFQNIDPPGNGLRIALEVKEILNIGSVTFSFLINSLPIENNNSKKNNSGIHIHDTMLSTNRWHFLVLTHDNKKSNNFSIFVDGRQSDIISVPYPNLGNGLLQMGVGGFNGCIGQSFFYELGLNDITINVLYKCGPTYNPPIYKRGHIRVAGFPRNVRHRAAPMAPGKYGYFLLPFCYSIDPKAISEVIALPRGWGEEIAERSENIDIITHPHNKSAIVSMGGICYIYYLLSPEFRGPRYYSDKQVVNVLKFITDLVSENLSLLRQLFTMGLASVKLYIINYIHANKRTSLVLNAIQELLMMVESNDNEKTKRNFARGFRHIIMDVPFWIHAPREVGIAVASYIHTLVETRPEIMTYCIDMGDIFDMVRSFFPNSIPNKSQLKDKMPNDADIRVSKHLLACIPSLMRRKPRFRLVDHRALICMIDQCKNNDILKSQLLTAYAEICDLQPDTVFIQINAKPGFAKVLINVFNNAKSINIKIKSSKLLMGFIRYAKKLNNPTSPSRRHHNNYATKAAMNELIYILGSNLGNLTPNVTTYISLLDIVLGRFKMKIPASIMKSSDMSIKNNINTNINNLNSDNISEEKHNKITSKHYKNAPSFSNIVLVSDRDQIKLGGALEGLMTLIASSDTNYKLRTRMLMDLLSLIDTNDNNTKLMLKQRYWPRWMANLICLELNDDSSACNQLVAKITSALIWRKLIKDDKGYIALFKILHMTNDRIKRIIQKARNLKNWKSNNNKSVNERNDKSDPANDPKVKIQCRILHEFLVHVILNLLNRFLVMRTVIHPKNSNVSTNFNNLSDRSDVIKGKVGKNLSATLNVTEWLLFNHRYSMLQIARIRLKKETKESDININMLFNSKFKIPEYSDEEIKVELFCLQRLLSCTLKFVSFKNERQVVLRRLLRYMKEILAHPSCNDVFDDCVRATKEFYTRMKLKKDANIKTVRIAYTFLKNAYLRFSQRNELKKKKILRSLQEEVYSFWGPQLFAENMDPYTLTQMNVNLDTAEKKLEKTSHHVHSLWVFLQHQNHWEYKFKDLELRNFKSEFDRFLKDTKQSLLNNGKQFKEYMLNCIENFNEIRIAEDDHIRQKLSRKRIDRKELIRGLKKYMDFFHEEYNARFPDEEQEEFWEIDPRETPNHTRLLLLRNFEGTNHPEAEYSKHKSLSSSKYIKQQKDFIQKKQQQNNNSNNNNEDDSILSANLRRVSVATKGIISTPKQLLQLQRQESNEHKTHLDSNESKENNNNDIKNTNSNEDERANEGWEVVNEEEQHYQRAQINQKVLFQGEAVQISPFYKIKGTVYITENHFTFEGQEYLENIFSQNQEYQIKLKKLQLKRVSKNEQNKDKELIKILEEEAQEEINKLEARMKETIEYDVWALNFIKSILPRRYLLRDNAMEMWIAGTSKSFFFKFENNKKRNNAVSLICKNSTRLMTSTLRNLPSPKKILKQMKLTEKWQKRRISNFDYLMELNMLAGRSYNDVTQYPVFPWVIKDYKSSRLDLKNIKKTFRDLTKPIGALNSERLQVFKERYNDSLNDDTFPPFYYGTHYMSAGIVLHYLVRLEPFTTLSINLQGGRFDLPDRLFSSIDDAWELTYNNISDVKEVVPEMYYFSEFLRNINNLPLGIRHDNNKKVSDVILPPWASTPEEYIRLCREALESDYVSNNLNHWIDLIFGYKQLGQPSIDSHNVFFHLTYAGAVDLDSMKDSTEKEAAEQQIYHFGQCPNQLFSSAHPIRYSKEQCNINLLELPFKFPPNYGGIIMKTFDLVDQPILLNIIRGGQCLKVFDMTERIVSFELPNLSKLDLENPFKSTGLRNIVDSQNNNDPPMFELMPPDWSESILYQSFVISSNGLYGISGGYLDFSIKIHYLRTGDILESVTALENGHNDVVTCLALSSSQDMLVSGSRDGTIVLWTTNCKQSKPGRLPLVGKPYRLLSIHFDSIRAIAINTKVGIIVSAADDGTIALYSIARKRFARQLHFNGRYKADNKNSIIPIREVVKIIISDAGYIVIHTLEDSTPYLRVFSLNGILIRSQPLNEILFCMKTDNSGKILITGGQSCIVKFRHIHNLSVIQEIIVLENSKNKNKSNKKTIKNKEDNNETKNNIDDTSPSTPILGLGVLREDTDRDSTMGDLLSPMILVNPNNNSKLNRHNLNSVIPKGQTHSTAWRSQRYAYDNKQNNYNDNLDIDKKLLLSKTSSLQEQRKSILSNRRRNNSKSLLSFSISNSKQSSMRRSTHFHGRFSSVDGAAILTASHIIDFDLDPENSFMIISYLDIEKECSKLLLYLLPNSKQTKHFDKYLKATNNVLSNAHKTIWNFSVKIQETNDILNNNNNSRDDLNNYNNIDNNNNYNNNNISSKHKNSNNNNTYIKPKPLKKTNSNENYNINNNNSPKKSIKHQVTNTFQQVKGWFNTKKS